VGGGVQYFCNARQLDKRLSRAGPSQHQVSIELVQRIRSQLIVTIRVGSEFVKLIHWIAGDFQLIFSAFGFISL
jgi:hypothetical protein